jgi:ribosomal RNA-processing protein 9
MVEESLIKKQRIAERITVDTTAFVKGHANSLTACAVSFDDHWVASAGKDGAVLQWDAQTQSVVGKFKPSGKAQAVRGVTFCGESFGGNVLVSCGEDKLVRLWDIRTPGDCVSEMKGHQGAVNGVKFAFDSATNAGKLYTVGSDKAVKMWFIDGRNGKVFDSFFGHTSSVLCIDMMSLDRPVTGGDDHSVRSWSLGRDAQTLFSSGGHTSPVDSVYMVDSSHYVSGGQDGAICVWGATHRKAMAHVDDAHGGNWVTAVSGIRNSDFVLSGSSNGHIKAWRVGKPGESDIVSKKTKIVCEDLDWCIDVNGVVNEIALSNSGSWAVAAVGRDHKHGRWVTANNANNGLLFSKFNRE